MRNKLPKPIRPDYHCEEHHVYPGARRSASDFYNCVIFLTPDMHRGVMGIHRNKEFRLQVQAEYQMKLEAAGWTRQEFIETFQKSYL